MEDDRVLVLDGAMGHELKLRGHHHGPSWSARALREAPEAVAGLHREYLDAGADVITTNTYACVPLYLEADPDLRGRHRELLERAGTLAAGACADRGKGRVAVSLPPLGESYQAEHRDRAELEHWYGLMVDVLEPVADIWLAETMTSLAELDAAAAAVPVGSELWLSVAVDESRPHLLPSGEVLLHVIEELAAHQPAAILVNCCASEVVTGVIADLGATAAGPVGGYANAFPPRPADFGPGMPPQEIASPARFADDVMDWVAAGARIVGGCCGTTPSHVAAIRDALAVR